MTLTHQQRVGSERCTAPNDILYDIHSICEHGENGQEYSTGGQSPRPLRTGDKKVLFRGPTQSLSRHFVDGGEDLPSSSPAGFQHCWAPGTALGVFVVVILSTFIHGVGRWSAGNLSFSLTRLGP